MMLSYSLFVIFVVVLLQGCSSGKRSTIGDLQSTDDDDYELALDDLSHQKVREEYREILELVADEELKQQIERRIADVYMLEGDVDQVVTEQPKSYYREAIKSYRDMLERYPNSPDNAEILYQLAKAYDIEGRQDEALVMLNRLTKDYPHFVHNSEALFRQGDIYFNEKHYRQAERSYRAVSILPSNDLTVNAYYMLGWALYKQAIYAESLDAYAYVLNSVLGSSKDLDALAKTERPLVEDTLHSMSLALVHQGGAGHIAKISQIAQKPYIWMLYENLGEYYLEKERFDDAATTYRAFVVENPRSDKAPGMHSQLIQSYILGGFPQQALPEKERFIESYGVHAVDSHWLDGGQVRSEIKPEIKKYLQELAKHYHGEAQQIQKVVVGAELKSSDEKGRESLSKLTDKSIASYASAARFYQEFIDTFPNDEQLAEMTYMKAETYFASQQYEQAIKDYEAVAYIFGYEALQNDKRLRATEAGYAAIISYQKLIDELRSINEKKTWQKKAVESMLLFSASFPQDLRSASVLARAAEYLFGLNEYERALQVANNLLNNQQRLDKDLKKTAYGIVAHSLYNLQRYDEAKKSYVLQRSLTEKGSVEYQEISEQIATSLYKNSEQLLTIDQQEKAVIELLSIKRLSPQSKIRVSAQYDAATMMLKLQHWSQAIDEFLELRSLFPDHKLAGEFPRKLAFAYEKNEQWQEAASWYMWLYRNDGDTEIQREALFVAATLYEKIEQYDTAISNFKLYANRYEQPFDTRMEARFHLAGLYEKQNDMSRHLYWLRRVIDGDKKSGRQRTDRSRWLGAWANVKYGDYFAWEYQRRKLRLPLKSSLHKKNQKLKEATSRYQQAADYNIFEFVTLSSYKIASLYEDMAGSLLASPRPKGLSASDSQMYTQILQQQAGPLNDMAMELHLGNISRAWQGQYNQWVDKSFDSMRELSPERYSKSELEVSYGNEIY